MNYDILLLATLSQDAFYLVNKKLVRKVGLVPALVLSFLFDKYKYYYSQSQLDSENGFYLKSKTKKHLVESELKLGRVARRSAFSELEKKKLLKIKKKGHPARFYYYLNHELILNLISEVETTLTSGVQTSLSSEVETTPTYNKNIEQEQKTKTYTETSTSSFLQIKTRLEAINKSLGFDYYESTRANMMLDKARRDLPGFDARLEKTLDQLEHLSKADLSVLQFPGTCLIEAVSIQRLTDFNCKLMAKIESDYKRIIASAPKRIVFAESREWV